MGAYFEGKHKEFDILDVGLKEWQQESYQVDRVTTNWTRKTVEIRLRVGFKRYDKFDITLGLLSG